MLFIYKMSSDLMSLYEYLTDNSNLLYPRKNIQHIIFNILFRDNYYKEKDFRLNSEEIIFFPYHTNEKSGDNLVNSSSLDNYYEENDNSITQIRILSISQTNEKSRENLCYLPSKDNYINKNDNNLNSKDNNLPPNLFLNELSELFLESSFFNPYIPIQNRILIEASNNNQINETRFIIASPKRREKRGRKTNRSSQKSHDSSSDDNCLLKLQIHFFNFIIKLTNEVLQNNNIKEKFILVDYKIKKQVNHNFFCELKSYSIEDILKMDTSSKYRNKSKDFNRETLNRINKLNLLNDFLNINYLKFFSEYYYNNEKPLLKFVYKGKEIKLSKAQSFYYLLNNGNNKGKKIEKDLSNIAKRFFIGDNSTFSKALFQTKKTMDLKE